MVRNAFDFPGPAEIIAHRGYSARAPENTLAALEAGIEAGADAVEFDLHTSADGVPVLFHDATLNRTTDSSGPLNRRSLRELRTLDAGRWFGDAFVGEPIPTFAEALALLGRRVERIYAEIKGLDAAAVPGLAEVVEEAGQQERTVFIAMDWPLLDRLREVSPDARVGYIVRNPKEAEEAIERAALDPLAILDFRAGTLLSEPPLAERIRSLGIPMAAWTIDDPEDASRLLDMGVPRITTNEVQRLVAWKRAVESGATRG